MDYRLDALIAYCQREGVLSTDEAVYDELADIWECSADEVEELFSGFRLLIRTAMRSWQR